MTWLCHCLFDLKCYPFGLTPVIWLECLWVRDVILLDSSFPSMIMKTLSRRCGTVLCHLWTLACHWCISVLASSLVQLGHMTLCHLLDLERYPFGLTPVAWLDCLWVRDVILLDSSFPSMIMKVLSRRFGFTLCHMWTSLCHWCISVLSSGLDAAWSYDMVTRRLRALSFWTHSCRMTDLFCLFCFCFVLFCFILFVCLFVCLFACVCFLGLYLLIFYMLCFTHPMYLMSVFRFLWT